MTYHQAIDLFTPPAPLAASSAVIFAAVFVAAALLVWRRPAYGLCALILTAPFAFYRDILGTTITIPKAALLGVLLGLTCYAANAGRLRERPMPLLLGALAFYLAATVLTCLDAAHRGATVRETFKVIEYAGLFVAAYLCYRLDPDGDALIVGCAAVASVAVCISALAQEVAGATSVLCIGPAIVPRIAGVLEGPNQLAGYLEIAIATLGAWAIRRRTPLIDAALAIAGCTAMLTLSRAGILGVAVVAATLTIACGAAALRALRPGFAGAAAGLAVLGGWTIAAHSANVLRAPLEQSACTGGVGNRPELWRAAWRMWIRHPLLGVGAGNFELELPPYGVFGVRTHANSWYLQSLAEGGTLLFAATLSLVAAIVATFASVVRSAARAACTAKGSAWILAALAASVALALHQIVDDLVFYPKVGGPWWLLLGIAAAAIAARRSATA